MASDQPTEHGAEPGTEHAGDHYVDALRRFRGDVRMMEQVLATMIERGEPRTAEHLGLMLDEYLAGRSLRKARAIIEQLDLLGVALDPARQYDVALATATAGSAGEALTIIDRLLADQRDPAPAQAPVVLDLLVGARRTPQAWPLFRRMRARGQVPSRDALLHLLADAQRRRAAKDSVAVIATLRAGGHRIPEARGGAIVRMLVGAGQLDRATEVLDHLEAAAADGTGAPPGGDVSGHVLEALAAQGRVDEVRARLAPLVAAGDPLSGHQRNLLLGALVAAGDLDAAWVEAERMWADACLPTGRNLEALLDLTLAAGNVTRAAGVLDLLLLVGVPVAANRSGAVLRAEMADGGLDRVLPVAAALLDRELVFDRSAARDLVERLVRARRLDDAQAWLERFRRAGTLTQGRSYGSLLGALVAAKRIDDALALLDHLVANGVRPERADVARLVTGRLKAGDTATAEQLATVAASVGVHTDEATLRELLWTHARASDVAGVDRVLELLRASGVTPDERHEKARAWASGATPRRLEDTTPDATTPDAATPDAATPDAATPDAATPDAASAEVGGSG